MDCTKPDDALLVPLEGVTGMLPQSELRKESGFAHQPCRPFQERMRQVSSYCYPSSTHF